MRYKLKRIENPFPLGGIHWGTGLGPRPEGPRWGSRGDPSSARCAAHPRPAVFVHRSVTIIAAPNRSNVNTTKSRQFHDMRDLGGARIAAVGPATANKLKELHLQVDLMPDEALASSIAEAFSKFESIENLKICLLRAEVANEELPKALEDLGAIVDDIPCYKTVPETKDLTGAAAKLLEGGADWVTFTSSSTVEHFHARFDLPSLLKKFPQIKTASIGPETSKALAALRLKPTIEAKEHSIEGLVDALIASRNMRKEK